MQYQFHVTGMTCNHCVRAVTEAVQAVDPAAQVKVDLPAGQVQIESVAAREALAHAITEEGYRVAG